MNIYKTCIRLSPHDQMDLMRRLNSSSFDAYTIHKMIYGHHPIEDNARFVFDAEHSINDERTILSYSDKRPVITGLDGYEYSVNSIDVDELFRQGESYSFELNVNAIKRKNGKAIFVHDDELGDWLEKRMQDRGMTIRFEDSFGELFNAVRPVRRYRRFTPMKNNPNGVNLHVAHCVGNMRILDMDKFKDALVDGIGRENAFGLGMLIVA